MDITPSFETLTNLSISMLTNPRRYAPGAGEIAKKQLLDMARACDQSQGASAFASTLKELEARGYADWTEDDANMASEFLSNLIELEKRGYAEWGDDEHFEAVGFLHDLQELEDYGYADWTEDDIAKAKEFVETLRLGDSYKAADAGAFHLDLD